MSESGRDTSRLPDAKPAKPSTSMRPVLQTVLQWAGAAYLLYMGWKLLFSGEMREGHAPQPVSFLQAAAFQFVNPKAWVMALTPVALFLPTDMSLPVACSYLPAQRKPTWLIPVSTICARRAAGR